MVHAEAAKLVHSISQTIAPAAWRFRYQPGDRSRRKIAAICLAHLNLVGYKVVENEKY